MKRIPRRLFTEAFKREVIKVVTEQNLNIAQAGCQLDIDLQSIRAWIAARIDNQMPTDFANMYYINNQIVA